MTNADTTPFASRLELNLPYAEAVQRVTAALKDEGFGVLAELDMRAILQQKQGVDIGPYVILQVCHPPFAEQVLQTDRVAGLLLPCSVVVYAQEGGSVVAVLNPLEAMGIAKNPALLSVAEAAAQKLRRALAALR